MAVVEQWIGVDGYPHHEVSNLGRVRSIDRVVAANGRWGGQVQRRLRGCILRPWNTNGYRSVVLAMGGDKLYVHRLVAAAFCPRREGATQVNHRNGDKADNRAVNLEWATISENQTHRTHVLGKRAGQFGPNRVRRAA